MANLTSVGITAGVPTSGSGTVSTIDALMAIAATAAKQDTGNTSLASILTKLADPATQTTLAAVLAKLSSDPATQTTLAAVATAVEALSAIISDGKLAVTASIDAASVNANGQTTMADSAPVVIASDQSPIKTADQYATHKEVAASQTAAVLGATGAAGDYLAGVTVYPGTAGCGVVTILDGTNVVGTFAGGGTTALPDLRPFTVLVGAFCTGAGWHITTGADVTVSAVGKFT